MKDEVFNDYVDITAPDFYARLKQDKTLVPSSTMPAIGELFELIEELESEGYNEVIVSTVAWLQITPSSGMFRAKMEFGENL